MTDTPAEWLCTDGAGGWAMGALHGAPFRRYHAWWMPASRPPVGRLVGIRLVLDEIHLPSGDVCPLTCAHFGPEAVIHPAPCLHATDIDLHGQSIRWTFLFPGGGRLERTLELAPGAVAISWRPIDTDARIQLRPLVTMRSAHHLLPEPTRDLHARIDGNAMRVSSGAHDLTLTLQQGRWTGPAPDWWRDMRFQEEARRGYDDTEAAHAPGVAEAHLGDGESMVLCGSLQHSDAPTTVPVASEHMLCQAAEQFIVTRGDQGRSIIAGYPWFADWGRDAMISIPGLLLARGRLDDAQRVLETWAGAMRNGLIPNRFDDIEDRAHYDTADASLWFIQSLCKWLDDGGRSPELLDAAVEVVDAYQRGTDFGIGIRDGLVEAGEEGCALTWMDAKTDGTAITPRRGRPVELSALWYDGLMRLAVHLPSLADQFSADAHRTESAFEGFWNESAGCCYDVLSDTPDASLRPNQLVACAVAHSPLSADRRRRIVDAVDRTLTTPFGLRTLDPADPRYLGTCEGDQRRRDLAYHNGTVWPWLLGPWLDARKRLGLDAQLPDSLLHTLETGCHGQLAEIFDGDAPHSARGCPAQAWSVAEVLRHVRADDKWPHA